MWLVDGTAAPAPGGEEEGGAPGRRENGGMGGGEVCGVVVETISAFTPTRRVSLLSEGIQHSILMALVHTSNVSRHRP